MKLQSGNMAIRQEMPRAGIQKRIRAGGVAICGGGKGLHIWGDRNTASQPAVRDSEPGVPSLPEKSRPTGGCGDMPKFSEKQ